MGLVHVKLGVTVTDRQGQSSKSQGYYWDPTWDTTVPGDAGAYAATALADSLTVAKTMADKVKDLTDAGTPEVMASEIRGFGAGVISTDDTEPFRYSSDKLVLLFVNKAGNVVHPEVPAPKAALLLSDKKTADLASATLQSLLSAMINNNAVDTAGNQYTYCTGGYVDSKPWKGKKAGGI